MLWRSYLSPFHGIIHAMTNEDVEKNVRFFADNQGYKLGLPVEKRKELSDALTGFVARHIEKAYDEVIQIAEGWDSASNGNHARNVADDVRELKDSLVAQTTS